MSPAVWDIGHMGYQGDTCREIRCSRFRDPRGFEELIDAHPDRSQGEIHVADCVLLGTSAPQLGAFAPRGIEFSRQRNVAQGVDDES